MLFAKTMKLLWFLTLGCAAVSATIFEQNQTRIHGDNGWYVPNLNGSFSWMEKPEAETYLESRQNAETFGLSLTPVKYYLYTKSNPKKGQKITADTKSIDRSNFDPAHPTRFVIHGWVQSRLSSMNKQIRNAWLGLGDYNVIVIDWARSRSVDYASSVLAVPKVGKKLAGMIDFLVETYHMPLDTLLVIGHSLGAHIAGYCGKNLKSGQIHTIIGLDPALPLYSYDKPKKRLAATDAFYVESIHTNGGKLGFLKPIGKAAFYPNGGTSQPGCVLDVAGICAHERSVTYYAESVARDNFGSIECESYKEAVDQSCGATYSSIRMGAHKNPYIVQGYFYVPVKSKSPFGILD